jgi:hypothetical protein
VRREIRSKPKELQKGKLIKIERHKSYRHREIEREMKFKKKTI